MSDPLPKDYVRVPFPSLPHKQAWEPLVLERCKIMDPDFHGGKTEAIRLTIGWREEEVDIPAIGRWPGRKGVRRTPIPGEWIEFRNFKEANAFVQAVKRMA